LRRKLGDDASGRTGRTQATTTALKGGRGDGVNDPKQALSCAVIAGLGEPQRT